MPDEPAAPPAPSVSSRPCRLRGAPLHNLNALKHWISRQRPANSVKPTWSTWLIPSSKASPKR